MTRSVIFHSDMRYKRPDMFDVAVRLLAATESNKTRIHSDV